MIDHEILKILIDEYAAAVKKHPKFAVHGAHAVSLILEELGELAKEGNDEIERNDKEFPDAAAWRWERAIREAAHVAVTAIRTMEMLKENMNARGI